MTNDEATVDLSWNQLKFPGSDEIFGYNHKDFTSVDIIVSSRHVIKEYIFNPLSLRMAVKIFRIEKSTDDDGKFEETKEKLAKEAKNFLILSRHPNILDFYGICMLDGEAMIFMELMDLSLYDLYLMVHKKNEQIPENILGYKQLDISQKTDFIAKQILDALDYCKKKENYMHRDVKPQNILLNKKGEVKLCDFGESRLLKNSIGTSFVGTIIYWPPERLEARAQNATAKKGPPYDVRSDVWSLGVTLAECAYGKIPFLDSGGRIMENRDLATNIIAVQQLVLKANTDELIERCFGVESGIYSHRIRDFVKQCMSKLEERPRFDKLVESEFYRYFADPEIVNQQSMVDFVAKYESEEDDEDEEDDLNVFLSVQHYGGSSSSGQAHQTLP